tara:strand:- start:175 stop:507 length:333 start_codon:yes stop_codon:yes gene_type:complete
MPVLGTQVIKSIQRGQTTITPLEAGGATTTTYVTITAVDLAKSFVSVSFQNGFGEANSGVGSGTATTSIAGCCYLYTTTSLRMLSGGFARSSSTASRGNNTICWEVIEYV